MLSLALESLQLHLPARTSSNLDLLANTAGSAVAPIREVAPGAVTINGVGMPPKKFAIVILSSDPCGA